MLLKTIQIQFNERVWLAFMAFVCLYCPTIIALFIYKGIVLYSRSWVYILELILLLTNLGTDWCFYQLRSLTHWLQILGLGLSLCLSLYYLFAQENKLNCEIVWTFVYIICKSFLLLSHTITMFVVYLSN